MSSVVAQTVPAHPDGIVIESTLLGDLVVPEQQIYRFPRALYGFPDATTFALVPVERGGFYWLQSGEFAALTFLLVDPFLFVDGYVVDVTASQLETLESDDAEEVLVLAILTLPRAEGEPATANLQGPVAFNVRRGIGMQLAIDSTFGVRHAIDLKATGGAP